MATGSTSPPGWKAGPSRAVSASRARCTTRSAASSTSASRTWASSRSRTSPGRSAPGAWPIGPRRRRRVAGLPFADPGGDPEQRSSDEGPAEGVIVNLASFRRREPSAIPAARQVAKSAPLPAAEHNLPQPNSGFVGRTAELQALRQALNATGAAPSPIAAGDQRAGRRRQDPARAAYAYAHLGEYDLIRWLRAEAPAVLAADYSGMAPALGLDPGMPDQAALIAAIRAKLELWTAGCWCSTTPASPARSTLTCRGSAAATW